jgi:hypothetical protein
MLVRCPRHDIERGGEIDACGCRTAATARLGQLRREHVFHFVAVRFAK